MRTLFALALLAAAATRPLIADGMTPSDRQRLLAHFEMTESWLVSETSGLSTAQLKYRPTPESWSVMDVVEPNRPFPPEAGPSANEVRRPSAKA